MENIDIINSASQKRKEGFLRGQFDAINNKEYYNPYVIFDSEKSCGYYRGWASVKEKQKQLLNERLGAKR